MFLWVIFEYYFGELPRWHQIFIRYRTTLDDPFGISLQNHNYRSSLSFNPFLSRTPYSS